MSCQEKTKDDIVQASLSPEQSGLLSWKAHHHSGCPILCEVLHFCAGLGAENGKRQRSIKFGIFPDIRKQSLVGIQIGGTTIPIKDC